jgi:hypothetical protein
MKRTINKIPIICATALCAVALAGPSAKANEISGSIGFGSLGVSIVGASLATATSFTVTDPFITTETGVYSGAPLLTPIVFNGFQFSPPVASVTPLWSFNVGVVNYSFDATSMSSFYDASLRQWDIGGSGLAMVTGYSATPGTWNVNLSQSGASIVFDSSAAAIPGVPDGGSTLLLLGGGFIGLAKFGRKLVC